MQWGYAAITSSITSISFPTSFPTACFNVQVTYYLPGDAGGAGSSPTVRSAPSVSGVSFSTASGVDGIFWTAIGR